MAEVDALKNNVLPYPIYGAPFAVVFPILDADGDPVTGAAGLDSEVSKNGDTFADCTNEAVEIATSSGIYYLSLTAAELTAAVVALIVKTSTTGAKTTPLTLYPRVLPQLRAATAQAGAAGTITLDANASPVDDYYNGCVIYIHTGTGAGQVRTIIDYAGSTKVASVSPNFATSPANDSQFYIYLTDMAVNAALANMSAVAGAAVDPASAQMGVNVVNWKGAAAPNMPANFADLAVTASTGRVTVGTNADKTDYGLSTAERGSLADAIHDEAVESALTLRQILRIMLAALSGKSAGGGTTTITFRDQADGKNRISATVDGSGNRTAVTVDGT